MIVKLFELRDSATFVPVMAVKVEASNEAERFLLRRSGYAPYEQYVILTGLNGGLDRSTCDPYDWGGNRTRQVAHQYLIEHFDSLESGAVIDVQHILGETKTPKVSERFTDPV